MADVIVIDNVVDHATQEKILEFSTGYECKWVYHKTTVGDTPIIPHFKIFDSDLTYRENSQFTCPLVWDQNILSNQYQIFVPILHNIHQKTGVSIDLFRLKLNLIPAVDTRYKNTYNTPHVDKNIDSPYWVMVYYIDDSDGDTIIYNEVAKTDVLSTDNLNNIIPDKLTIQHRISPKKGRAVIFNGKYLHSGCPPVDTNTRLVANFNFFIGD